MYIKVSFYFSFTGACLEVNKEGKCVNSTVSNDLCNCLQPPILMAPECYYSTTRVQQQMTTT